MNDPVFSSKSPRWCPPRKAAFAREVRKKLPKSEVWFLKLWVEEKMPLPKRLWKGKKKDLFNRYLYGFLPDISNTFFRYAIEIDGSVHLTDEQKAKDARKDDLLRSKGIEVIRVIAYDEGSAKDAILRVWTARHDKLNTRTLTRAQRRYLETGLG